jgi:hypothetical protein
MQLFFLLIFIYIAYKLVRFFIRIKLFINRSARSTSRDEEYSVPSVNTEKKYKIDQKDIIDAEFEEVKKDAADKGE